MDPISLSELASLAIVGAVVSFIVQFLKSSSNSSPTLLRLTVVALSLVTGGAYYLLRDTSFWTSFTAILAIANTVFLFIVKPLEENGTLEGR